MSDVPEISPLDLLTDELKNDDVNNRVEAMKKLDMIALALGPQKTRDALLPFLADVAQDDEDEVFVVLAQELGKMIPAVGGAKYAYTLLPVLEILASTEETLVREEAVTALNTVADSLSDQQLFQDYVPMVERLGTADWFSPKVSACGLFKPLLARAGTGDIRKRLLAEYLQLLQDDTPMVRRVAAKDLPQLLDTLSGKDYEDYKDDWEYMSDMYQKIAQDSIDSVRLLAVDVMLSVLQNLTNNASSTFEVLLSSLSKLCSDKAWKVRCHVADKFNLLAQVFSEKNRDYLAGLLQPFVLLCEDNESDVRTAIAKQVSPFGKLLDDKQLVAEKILPAVKSLSRDENELVRASLASVVCELGPLITEDDMKKELLPTVSGMLRDEFPDVRLHIIGGLKNINSLVGKETLSEDILPTLRELTKDINWRVRMAVIKSLATLARTLGKELFDEQLTELSLSCLCDTVYKVREAAITNLQELAELFGPDWCQEKLIAKLLNFDPYLMQNFIYRFTILAALTALVKVSSVSVVVDEILPFVAHLTDDPVPNIRFNVAKAYPVIAERVHNESNATKDKVKTSISMSLEKLVSDKDVDVKYFSKKSQIKCDECLK